MLGILSGASPSQRTAQHAHKITEAATLVKQLRKRTYREAWGTCKEAWGFAGSLGCLQCLSLNSIQQRWYDPTSSLTAPMSPMSGCRAVGDTLAITTLQTTVTRGRLSLATRAQQMTPGPKNGYTGGFAHPIQLSQLPLFPSRQTREWIGLWKNIFAVWVVEHDLFGYSAWHHQLQDAVLRFSFAWWQEALHACVELWVAALEGSQRRQYLHSSSHVLRYCMLGILSGTSSTSSSQGTAQHAHKITEAATLLKQLRKRTYGEAWGTCKEPWGFAGSLGCLQRRSYAPTNLMYFVHVPISQHGVTRSLPKPYR